MSELQDYAQDPLTKAQPVAASPPNNENFTETIEAIDKQESQERIDRREELKETDSRSIYVGNVDFQTVPDELEQLFHSAGLINRITILNDKFTGKTKGYAYVEFDSLEALTELIKMDGIEFKGRILKVSRKRTNFPGKNDGRSRGRGRGRGRGEFSGYKGNGNGGYGGYGGGFGGAYGGTFKGGEVGEGE